MEVDEIMAKKSVAELWIEIFNDYDVLNKIEKDGFFKILSTEIKKYKEPRLMAKFDYSKQLPQIFKDNCLGILPIKNGEYIIGKFNLFEKISKQKTEQVEIKKVSLPDFIEAIDPDNIYSESNALNVALLSGMLEDTFGEEVFETVQGKMRTNEFNFNINSYDNKEKTIVDVNGAAIEIDGGYEGTHQLVLVEAKNNFPDDFIIRQLYYPYRYWKDKVSKMIIPAFLAYENGIYNIFVYSFEDTENYNSLKLKKVNRYMLSNKDSEHLKKVICESVETVEEKEQSEVPFPQADSFTKVLGTMECIDNELNTANKIAEYYEFDIRQGKYYIDALRYLNIVINSKQHGQYELTSFGKHLLTLDVKNRNKLIIEEILKHKPFNIVFAQSIYNGGNIPEKEYIKEILSTTIPELAEETVNRRSSTIKSWIDWIKGAQI